MQCDATIKKQQKQHTAITYKGVVLPEGNTWHEKPCHAMLEVLCCPDPGLRLHKLCCVLRQCKSCPTYPIPALEEDKSENASMICFHEYVAYTQCSAHGLLTLYAKSCEKCEEIAEGGKRGKISTKNSVFASPSI